MDMNLQKDVSQVISVTEAWWPNGNTFTSHCYNPGSSLDPLGLVAPWKHIHLSQA